MDDESFDCIEDTNFIKEVLQDHDERESHYSSFEYYLELDEVNIKSDSPKKHSNEQELYQCTACNNSFTDVMEHIKKFHKHQSVLIEASEVNENSNESSEDKFSLYNEDDNNVVEEKVENDLFYICDDTSTNMVIDSNDIIFDDCITEEKLNDEISINYIDELKQFKQVEETIDETELLKNLKNSIGENLFNSDTITSTCSICKTIFPSQKNLKLHLRMHNPVKSKRYEEVIGDSILVLFNCELCGKSFDIKLKEQHSKFHQENVSKTTCNICNKLFKNEESFRMHLRLHKINGNLTVGPLLKKPTKAEKAGIIYPYACQHCGRTFKRPYEKVKHERIHTGEKPFKCDVCGKCFRVSYSLTLHLRTHTGIRPYICNICNKRFKGFSTYSHHLLTHSEERKFKCPECPKTFKTQVQLHGHKNTHTKPFFCEKCNRPFATMYAVEVHMDTHKKELNKKQFKYFCDICGASYGRSFALEEHKKVVHNPSDIIERNLEYFCNEETVIPSECLLSSHELFKEP